MDDLQNKSLDELKQLLDSRKIQYDEKQEAIRQIRSYDVRIPQIESALNERLRKVPASRHASSSIPQVQETGAHHASINILPNVPGSHLTLNNLQSVPNFQFNLHGFPQVQDGIHGIPQAPFPPIRFYGSHNSYNRHSHGNSYNMQIPPQPVTVIQPYPQPINVCVQNHFVQPQKEISGNSQINNSGEPHNETVTKTKKNNK